MKSLRDYRASAGLTQIELAEKAGIRVATLSSLENSKSQPHRATLTKLANALNIDPETLSSALLARTSEQKQNILQQIESDWQFLTGLDKDLRAGLAQSLVAEWTHSSTALEGNTISAGDTLFILTEGLTINGKRVEVGVEEV
jgi:transcriptional regulator with XRE-family HTH domain